MRTKTQQQPYQQFGEMLREARLARKLDQRELAERLHVGQQAVSNWERGRSRPSNRITEALAAVFPEHPASLWFEITGRTATKLQEAGRPLPTRPLVPTLPLHELSFQDFQRFCAQLLEFQYGSTAEIHLVGVEGDAQDGIDIEVRFADGRLETFQCKREKSFGPAKVRRAMDRHRVRCNRAWILLSRPATAGARKALGSSRRWGMKDSEDIARQVRGLPLSQQKRLVATYFHAYQKDFLGISDHNGFVPADEYFAPLLRDSLVFSHAWTLVGRDEQLARVLTLLERPRENVTLLVGTGGIGKSRLLKAVSDASASHYPGRGVFVLPQSVAPTAEDYALLSDAPSLVIIEDAHDHPHLSGVLETLARCPADARILIITRPYALELIRGEAIRNGFRAEDEGTVVLAPLTVADAEKVAEEILRVRKGPVRLARRIAEITHESPLALVVGASLVATKHIDPATLANAQEFRDTFLRAFRDALTGSIGTDSDKAHVRQVLDLVSLLQPLDPDAPSFKQLATSFLQLREDRVRRAIDVLHHAGVLVRRGRLMRILPDVFGEFVLEDVCVSRSSSGSSGYFEQVMKLSDERLFASILLNVSKLDWRLSDADTRQSRLADAAWKEAESVFEHSPLLQETIGDAVAQTAFYQPQRALAFYNHLRSRGITHSQLPVLLRYVAMHGEHTDAAVRALWNLGVNDTRPLNQYPAHPLRILADLAAIEPNKPLYYCERVVTLAMHAIDQGHAGLGEHSAFAILRSALATEGHTTESRGHSFVMSPFAVRREAVATLRETIVDFLLRHLADADLATAIQAARTLHDALRYPHGILGRPVSKDERESWAEEFAGTLRKVRECLGATALDPFVLVEIHHAIHWLSRFGRGSIREAAQAVVDAIPNTLPYRVSLCLRDAWGHLAITDSGDVHRAMAEWRQEQSRIASELSAAYPDTAEAVEFLEERLHKLRMDTSQHHNPSIFLRLVLEGAPPLAGRLCDRVLADPNGPLRDVFAEALVQLMKADPERCLVVARGALATSSDVPLSRAVADALRVYLATEGRADASVRTVAEELVRSDDPFTAIAIVHGIAAQARFDLAWATATLLTARIDKYPQLADEVCSVVTSKGDIPFESLEPSTIVELLERLGTCPSIDDYWVRAFMAETSRVRPADLVAFLMRRIERDGDDESREFSAMPHAWDEQPGLRFREVQELPMLLRRIREWLLQLPENGVMWFWGPKLYAAVAGPFDELVLTDLQEWSRSGDANKMHVIGRILSEAGTTFVFRQRAFVVELLDGAALISQDSLREISSALFCAAVSGMRHGSPGRPFPEDESRRDQASEALGFVSPGSPAWTLYDGLRVDAETDIRVSLQRDEELFIDA